jgi:hypothetical protein
MEVPHQGVHTGEVICAKSGERSFCDRTSTGERANIVLSWEKRHSSQLMASILTPTIEYHCAIGTDDMDGVLSKKYGVLSVTNGSYAH